MNKKIFLLLPALGLLLCGCPGPKEDVPPINDKGVKAVEVDHDAVSLEVGQTFQLAASVKPITLEDRTYTWSSDAATVASVDASGMVTAIEEGTAHIRATANADTTKYAECTVTVTPEMVTVALTDPAAIMASTETLKFGANQKNVGKYYFFKGTVGNDTRGETSESWADGVEVKLESAGESKYYITFNDAEGKKYFEMDDDHHYEIVATPTEGRKWDWNSTYGTVQRTIGSKTYLPGTYNTYTTISGCDLAQAATDFFFQFVYKTAPVAPQTITLSAESNKIYQGGTLQVEATLAPAAAKGNLNWTVTGDEHVTVSNKGLVSATQEAALNASITVKAAYAKDETIFGELTLTVAEYINYGTLEAPLTIAEAKAVIDKFPSGTVTPEKLFVKGFVSLDHVALSTTARGDVWLASDDGSVQKAFELYSVYADASLTVAANSLVGKEVIAEGWGTFFARDSVYEFSAKNPSGSYDNGFVRAITNNTRTATSIVFDPAETFEIPQGGNQTVSAALYPYGATGTISYAVSPANQGVTYENGKVVAAANATVGAYTLTATSGSVNGSLAFTVAEASSSTPITKEINTAVGQWTVTGADSSSEQATLASDPFNFVYNVGTATTYISSYSNNSTYAIRFYAGSNVSISWGNTVKVQSITFTTNSKHFATNATFTGGALDSSYTATGDTCKVNVNEDATSLSWSNAAQVRLDKVVIVYTVA